ncbi:FKBP-type peptidyl-prolyl cis-trans isomerase [Pseudomonas lurida]|uniref:FKBP-type peptidyl-prolyl cis-trans isomerase n=1 Tax=Pseudomonas lurida TaxID=244566 RepID=UPI0016493859|nr:FKBP-type peptidyl-prolyl cis-trans isomerase [Pseudomonas lurida]MBC3236931.1 FKBP-type peptidyl-prolyl cis-trans isomerase [Pseudomonas lurida]
MTIVKTSSGLQYEDIVVGSGPTVSQGQSVGIQYTGRLTNASGHIFDSSRTTFTLEGGQVIRGLDEGIVGMSVGGRRQLTIPPDLGYDARGAGGGIPPNATLWFEVELISIT